MHDDADHACVASSTEVILDADSLLVPLVALNDNTMLEHLVQDELFLGVVGILECEADRTGRCRRGADQPALSPDDPEFPTLKASYRDFISTSSRFREPVHFEDEQFRAKIHQTYRLLYLKDVVLARVLDDPNFNIINSLLFFNQVDIINYIQSNESLLNSVFGTFKRRPESETDTDANIKAADAHKAEVVALLHQLVLMGKNVQLPNRLGLYRNLVERGLLYICGWSFRQSDLKVLSSAAEIMALILDHDVHSVRAHALKERSMGMRTIARECVELIASNREIGISGQIADALRAMLDTSSEDGPTVSAPAGPRCLADLSVFRRAPRMGRARPSRTRTILRCTSTTNALLSCMRHYCSFKITRLTRVSAAVAAFEELAEILRSRPPASAS